MSLYSEQCFLLFLNDVRLAANINFIVFDLQSDLGLRDTIVLKWYYYLHSQEKQWGTMWHILPMT